MSVAIIAIGRNEGERLKACLRSLPGEARIVYVDSGSTDGSIAFARSMDVDVVELDMTRPFTAARARNAGLDHIIATGGQPEFVQMIDGDCAIDPAWIGTACAALRADDTLAVVFGRRREKAPDRSIYNRMCDDEWDVPVGDVLSCGGDALFRFAPLHAAGGYDPDLIAGEEPELCARLRASGHHIRRIDAEMTAHDAAMSRFSQYWRRAKRSGHAFAELAWRRPGLPDPLWAQRVKSISFWAAALPLAFLLVLALGFVLPQSWYAAALIALVYPLQIARMAWRKRQSGADLAFSLKYAALLMIGKFAEFQGVRLFHWRRLRGHTARLIEYKGQG